MLIFIFKSFFFNSYSAFKAAEQDDLWHYLTQKAHLDGTLPSDVTVKTIMDTWTLQMGFPVVNVTRDYDSNEATLIQVNPLIINHISYVKFPLTANKNQKKLIS